MPNLDGTGRWVDLPRGCRIAAPGLRGTVVTHAGREPLTRGGGPERATEAFDNALKAAGVNNILTIEMEVRSAPVPGAESLFRTPLHEDGLALEVPDLGEMVGQVVPAIDEDGVVTWNFPLSQEGIMETPSVRGAGGSKRFLIRRHIPETPPAAVSEQRGLIGMIGRKILKVLVYKVTDPILGPISEKFARNWEEKKRPYLIRWFNHDNYLRTDIPELSGDDWKKLSGEKALLFVHGTTSTAQTGFATFPRDTLQELYQRYGGRVFAFNHFTLSVDPEKNADWFLQQIPDGCHLDLDIICHSRGGLIARTLAGGLQHSEFPSLHVSRIVFIGVPNHGTALADPDHLVEFIDRYTTILNLAPPGPASVVCDTLEAIITIVKVIAHAALNGLPGLTVMNPGSTFLQRLNAPGMPAGTLYYAITSNFEPKGGLKDLVKKRLADQLVDRVFENEANDILVPTAGVYEGIPDTIFPITGNQLLLFGPGQAVAHSDYFAQPETSVKLKQWL